MCAARRFVVSPAQLGGTWRKVLGSTAYLEAKARGDKSMPVKRRAPEASVGGVPQDPRDMAEAGLPTAQSPAGESDAPIGMTPGTDAAPCLGMNRRPRQPPWCGPPSSEDGQGDEWAAYVALDTYDEDERGIACGARALR